MISKYFVIIWIVNDVLNESELNAVFGWVGCSTGWAVNCCCWDFRWVDAGWTWTDLSSNWTCQEGFWCCGCWVSIVNCGSIGLGCSTVCYLFNCLLHVSTGWTWTCCCCWGFWCVGACCWGWDANWCCSCLDCSFLRCSCCCWFCFCWFILKSL